MDETAKGPIFIAAAITLAATLSHQYSKTKNQGFWITPTIGVFIMLLFLFLIAQINPRLAILFAWLIAIGSLSVNGQALFGLLQSAQSGTRVPVAKAPLDWVLPNLNPFTAISDAVGNSSVGGAFKPSPLNNHVTTSRNNLSLKPKP